MKKRTFFFVDGFNMYHSIIDSQKKGLGDNSFKWLDLKKLFTRFINTEKEELSHIIYFTSIWNQDHEKRIRHKKYLKALELRGVEIIFGKFKKKKNKCPFCEKSMKNYEEKRTDVNIAVTLLEAAFLHKYDTAVVVSGDTDLIPAIEKVKNNFPDKRVGIIFPFNRTNLELTQSADFTNKIKISDMADSLFPTSIELSNNKLLTCPVEWLKNG